MGEETQLPGEVPYLETFRHSGSLNRMGVIDECKAVFSHLISFVLETAKTTCCYRREKEVSKEH